MLTFYIDINQSVVVLKIESVVVVSIVGHWTF